MSEIPDETPGAARSDTRGGWSPGDWFRVTLPDGRTTGGQVLALGEGVVGLSLSAGRWTCAVGRLDLEAEPLAVPHLVVPVARLTGAERVGPGALAPEAEGLQAAWAAGDRAVVDAPLPVLVQALSALAGED